MHAQSALLYLRRRDVTGIARAGKEVNCRMSEHKHSDDNWRMLVLATAALAYPLTQTSYSLATTGVLQLEQKLVAWTTVTATMITLLLLPKQVSPAPRWQISLLAVPSVWMAGRAFLGQSTMGEFFSPILYVIGIASFALFFPYAIYLLVRVANPHFGPFNGLRQWSILVVISISFIVVGAVMGRFQDRFVDESATGLFQDR
jgi:hypothetical protein